MRRYQVTHAYVAMRDCGHPIELVVDLPEDPRFTAGAVAEFIAQGFAAERVTLERARELGVAYCYCVPTMAEADKSNSVANWQTTAGGLRKSRTLLGGFTGIHVDALFLDDPDDAHKVHSACLAATDDDTWESLHRGRSCPAQCARSIDAMRAAVRFFEWRLRIALGQLSYESYMRTSLYGGHCEPIWMGGVQRSL